MYIQVQLSKYSFIVLFLKGLKPTDVISFFDEVDAQVQQIYKFFNEYNGILPQVIVRHC